MLNKIFRSVSNGEAVKVIEFDDKSKQCIVELENGKTRAYSSATLKDKRKFIPVEADEEQVAEAMEQKEVEAPGLVSMPGSEKLAELKEEITNNTTKTKKSERKSLRLKEVTYKGETKSIREWAEETGIRWKTLYNRINNNGWPVDLALETPEGQRRPKNEEA